ncbi:MAG: radical SAM protein [Candidatus Hadarchaeales archaeon]
MGRGSDGSLPVAGKVDLTTLDWPGKLATVVFLPGCNLRCPWCQNARLLRAEGTPTRPEELSISPLSDALVLSGGEPTVHDLFPFLSVVRRVHPRLSLAVETNGTLPSRLLLLVAARMVTVFLDVKAPLDDPELYGRMVGLPGKGEDVVEGVRTTLSLLERTGAPFELRHTVVPGLTDDPEVLRRLASSVGYPVVLQGFRPEGVEDPRFRALPPVSPSRLRSLAEAHPLLRVRGVEEVVRG